MNQEHLVSAKLAKDDSLLNFRLEWEILTSKFAGGKWRVGRGW